MKRIARPDWLDDGCVGIRGISPSNIPKMLAAQKRLEEIEQRLNQRSGVSRPSSTAKKRQSRLDSIARSARLEKIQTSPSPSQRAARLAQAGIKTR